MKKIALVFSLLVAMVATLGADVPNIQAAPGDSLATVAVPVPSASCCGIGIDMDGTGRIVYTNFGDPTLHFTDLSGNNLGSLPLIMPVDPNVPPGDGFNAIAFNATDGMMY